MVGLISCWVCWHCGTSSLAKCIDDRSANGILLRKTMSANLDTSVETDQGSDGRKKGR